MPDDDAFADSPETAAALTAAAAAAASSSLLLGAAAPPLRASVSFRPYKFATKQFLQTILNDTATTTTTTMATTATTTATSTATVVAVGSAAVNLPAFLAAVHRAHRTLVCRASSALLVAFVNKKREKKRKKRPLLTNRSQTHDMVLISLLCNFVSPV
jgi:hypothetical protein